MKETRIWSLGQEDPLEKEVATHSGVVAWEIPWAGEPGRLQSAGSQSQARLRDWTAAARVALERLFHTSVTPQVSLWWEACTVDRSEQKLLVGYYEEYFFSGYVLVSSDSLHYKSVLLLSTLSISLWPAVSRQHRLPEWRLPVCCLDACIPRALLVSILIRIFLTSEKVVVISLHLGEVPKQEELTLVIELRAVVALGGRWRVW